MSILLSDILPGHDYRYQGYIAGKHQDTIVTVEIVKDRMIYLTNGWVVFAIGGGATPAEVPKLSKVLKEGDELLPHIKKMVDELSDLGRCELFSNYCLACGIKDPQCKCYEA